jgi:nucleoside-diphosphate kinase
MVGLTDPQEADVGTIRGDYVQEKSFNIIHASDSPESAEREIALWFGPEELVEWDKIDTPWMTETGYEEHVGRKS